MDSQFKESFDNFFTKLTGMFDAHQMEALSNAPECREYLAVKYGKKYIKICRVRGTDVCSVFCFVDQQGNILKAASWNAPAKHARGNIFDADNGMKQVGPYGPAYLR